MLKECGERSRIVKEALRASLCLPEPQDELAVLKQQMQMFQSAMAKHLSQTR